MAEKQRHTEFDPQAAHDEIIEKRKAVLAGKTAPDSKDKPKAGGKDDEKKS